MTYRANSQIYLLRPIGMPGPVKIGCSEMPAGRLETLAAWSPFPLEIIARFPGSFALERNLHEHFARSHLHREWFKPTPDIVEFVAKIVAGVPAEQAADLTVCYPELYRVMKRQVRQPHFGLHMSYFHRTRHAIKLAEQEMGERRFRSAAVDHALACISAGELVTEEWKAVLEAFIADPVAQSLSYEQCFGTPEKQRPAPKQARASQ